MLEVLGNRCNLRHGCKAPFSEWLSLVRPKPTYTLSLFTQPNLRHPSRKSSFNLLYEYPGSVAATLDRTSKTMAARECERKPTSLATTANHTIYRHSRAGS